MIVTILLCPRWRKKAHASHEQIDIASFWGEIETGFLYDDNIFQVKDGKESDMIWESNLSLSYLPKEIKWSARAIFDRYRKNNELNYVYYEVGMERPFGQRNYGSVVLHLSPSALLDKQDPNREPFSLESYGFSATVDRNTDRIGNIGINFSYTRLDYGAPFNAKDTNILSLSPSLFYRMGDYWRFLAEVTYEKGDAQGGFILTDIPDDISYTALAASFKIVYQVRENTRLRFRYKIRKKRFSTEGADAFHKDRNDANHALYAEIQYNPVEKVSVFSRIDRLWRNSNLDFVAFNETRWMLSVAYRF